MRKVLLALPVTLALAGCNPGTPGAVTTTARTIANIISHSGQACSDLAALGSNATAIAQQAAAANPNNAQIQKTANDVVNGAAATNSSCQMLAASFKAEAPDSLLDRKIRLDPHVFTRIK